MVMEMEYIVVLEPDVEGKGYVAFCPTLPGCLSQGDTRDEALANIKEAIEAYIESLEKDGLSVPSGVRQEIASVRVYE